MEALDWVGKEALHKVNDKGFVPDEIRNSFFRKLRMKSENRSCFECPARNPTWISLTYSIYLCLECSGEHRRKGVHISFVRSVELDSFTPEQMVQMAAGGNGKALEYFKSHEMGKLSGSGRPVDYHSKAVQRYRAQLEGDAKKLCEKYGLVGKSASQASSKVEEPATDSVDQAADFSFEAPAAKATSASPSAKSTGARSAPSPAHGMMAAPSPTAMGYPDAAPTRGNSAPAVVPTQKPAHSVPSSHVVRRAEPAAPAPKATGFAPGMKQMAKQIDFDFDFDDLESEASKPKPVPEKPQPAPAPTPVKEVAKPPPDSNSKQNGALAGFANKKGISSSDFFDNLESETAQARMERESRFNKFAGAGAISSASYFGDGDEDIQNNTDDLSSLASIAAGRGAEMARNSFAKGAEMLSEYLAKVRD